MSMEQTRYSRLANITKLINTKLELRDLLEQVTTAISEEIVQCDAVGIYLPQEDGTFRGYVGKPKHLNVWTLDMHVIDTEIDLLAREVIESQKKIYIPDTSKDHRPDPTAVAAFQIKSLLALPISFEQELFGLVFLFDYGQPMNLTELEIQTVEAYVNMAAVAIRNALNLAEKEKLISEKQLLLDVTRELSMCSTLQSSLDICFNYLGRVLSNNHMGVHLLDPTAGKNILQVKVGSGIASEWKETFQKMGPCNESVLQAVMKTKKALLIPDASVDDRLNQEICKRYGIKGLFLIPLVSMGEVLGILGVVHTGEDPLVYSESQHQLAQSIVDATASTLYSLLYMDKLESMYEKRTKELEVANEQNHNVIESITDGFIVLSKDWKYLYVNKYQDLPMNKTPEDVIGKVIWEEFPSYIDTVFYKEYHRVMADRIPTHFETHASYSDKWFDIVVYPYGDGICSLIKDITEKKKYEKELKRLSGLDLIAQMAAGISHEIRNPMTTVRGFLQILEREDEFGRYQNYLHIMIDELDRANNIISEFLSMSNTRSSDLQKLNLNSIISDMTPLIHVDAFNQNKYIEIETNDLPEIMLNRDETRQLIINLYRNGLEAMSEGKILKIKTYMEDGYVVLAVQDQGQGIKPDVFEKLGTPFFTTKDKGTGLGLGVCYAIAARHQAKIDIQTGPDGTTFFIRYTY
ncbi:nitrogen-specific signal transduction histidine kinase/GAF domain-containing protein [Bacillus sp. SORGH_AS 510]|uniref:GAF domain-containing sensor histidine kinase n=1 Tax=Bacillus sp. SORGH_AS_0510 TaxID=3041771 RepID=UPI00277D655B|nr:GAF domain-containing protein [Bacillus sp. SORGH_AS_0510]MDQ1146101.1 nitrogen-specific signal transduction histidine kinase/GAF domain-containing protein [Bacillus sp. SORGH_AS_0510]